MIQERTGAYITPDGKPEKKLGSRYSEETRPQLHAAIALILDNAPSAMVQDVSAYLTKRAG
jgi:hypothetical protein